MTGKQHSAINFTAAVVVFGLSIPLESFYPLEIGLGILWSIIMSNDLDVDNGNISILFFRQSFGAIGAWYWQTLWKPYAINFAHRGISHTPIAGTLTRLIYIILPASLFLLPYEVDKASIIAVLKSQLLAVPFTLLFVLLIVTFPLLLIRFVIGICIGDILHTICDHL